MPPQLPRLYGDENFPQEPLRSAFIETIKKKQAEAFPDLPEHYRPITPGQEIIVLHLIIKSLAEASAKVNPRNQSTNGNT